MTTHAKLTGRVWRIRRGARPVVAAAVHDGHAVRPEIRRLLALGERERLQEEDPYTARWTRIAPTRIVALRSRFEVDLNRLREKAVYRTPEDAWGLGVWRMPLPDDVLARSLAEYDAFYGELHRLLTYQVRRYGRFVLYDLHSYNHRRGGPEAPPDDPAGNPDVNLGTGSMDRTRWASVVDAFLGALRSADVMGRALDVRENVRFQGGHLCRWVHETFPGVGCALAVDVKKFFMDEWTGQVDALRLRAVGRALERTVGPVLRALVAPEPLEAVL